MAKSGIQRMSRGQRKAVVRGAFQNYGSGKSWNADTLKKMSAFLSEMKKKEIKELSPEAVSWFVFLC